MTTPLCIECRWCEPRRWWNTLHCQHPSALIKGDDDYVHGGKAVSKDSRLRCQTARELRSNCGPDGRNFEPLPETAIDRRMP